MQKRSFWRQRVLNATDAIMPRYALVVAGGAIALLGSTTTWTRETRTAAAVGLLVGLLWASVETQMLRSVIDEQSQELDNIGRRTIKAATRLSKKSQAFGLIVAVVIVTAVHFARHLRP
jgi:hypothetical protein